MDMKLEVVVVPVSDVDRAKSFYGMLGVSAGYRLHRIGGEDFRVGQLKKRAPGR